MRWHSLLRWKNALNHDYKINNDRNFQVTKFSFIDFVLTDKRSLSGKRPKSVSGKSSGCRFSFSAERNANTKATEYVTFGFSFEYCGFLPPLEKSEPHCLSAIRIFLKCFRRHYSKKLWQTTCIENREGFAVHSSTWPSGAKGEWRVSSWLAISTHVKKYRIFSRVLLRLFSRPEIPV